MVMAQSLFKVLREAQPESLIDVLAPAWSRPILQRMPEVNGAIDLPLAHGELALGKRKRLGHWLRGEGYDQAILLPNTWKSALIPWLARIPVRTGWLGEMRYGLLNDWRQLDRVRLPMTVQRFNALAYPKDQEGLPEIPSPRLVVKVMDIQAALASLGLEKGRRPILALCPGAEYGPAKQWPAAYFGELALRHLENQWDVWLFGSDKDRLVCSQVNAVADGRCRDLSGRTSLAQAVDLMALADAVVSNDSGLMHVAAALDRRLVAIYGSSDPGFTPPLSDKARVLSLALACSPCFQRECPKGHLDCLRRLSIDQVVQALADLPR
ncbi:MAG: lipopolysaccharide heptosyltransferase II [Gammaproteobacteria bacterium]|nr:lipopolysaccharide heptosyltransferase II [Gammaproteobacteria bacterium]MBU1653666.1 lipopolysaccharide heptosyltransferase II [Gammaproteobacteria bacterium]MBU1962496.1 lipopolysaccharide heptosyltransferase II [Gammaproteobacteria bacterium]